MEHAAEKTIGQLLPHFYKQYGLDADGGHADSKVKIEMGGGLYFYIPNWDDRRKALLIHDIHHIVTEYPSTFKGETEISSWEIGSSCQKYWAAWALDMQGMAVGLFFNLPGIFRAFVRGTRSLNLYSQFISNREALDISVARLRHKIKLPDSKEPLHATAAETIRFMWWLFVSCAFSFLTLFTLPFLMAYNVFVFAAELLKRK